MTFNDAEWRRSQIAEIRKGDYVDSMGEIGLVNKVKGQVAYVKFDSRPGTFHPMLASSLNKTGKHKGKDLYTESVEINEMGSAWLGMAAYAIFQLIKKWAKKNPKEKDNLKKMIDKEL
tara:strand:- start:971 stop:1324 length:354 start_codon:yes stop_codon:yes gene_type:complete